MRVAALYDIHGNLPALDAVLGEPRLATADLVVCGGDLVAGPMPRQCFDRMLALGDRVRFVRGNADRLVVERAEGFGSAWCADQLGAERLAVAAAWPLTQRLEVDGLGEVVFCHATLRTDEEIVTRSTPESEVLEAFPGEPPLVVVGHTHVQFDRAYGSLRIVNAGSVGMPYEGRPGAFWALLGDGTVEFCRTEYDVEAAAAAIGASAWSEADELAGRLADPPAAAEATEIFEQRRRGA